MLNISPSFFFENSEYILLIILVFSFLEVVVPPIPGDTVLVLGSTVAAAIGLNPLWSILAATCGTFAASMILYFLGYRYGKGFFELSGSSLWLNPKLYSRIQNWYQKYGWGTLLGSRFLPAARSGVILVAGIVRYKRSHAFFFLTLSILLSSTMFVCFGHILGHYRHELQALMSSSMFWIILIPAAIAFGGGIWFFKKSINHK